MNTISTSLVSASVLFGFLSAGDVASQPPGGQTQFPGIIYQVDCADTKTMLPMHRSIAFGANKTAWRLRRCSNGLRLYEFPAGGGGWTSHHSVSTTGEAWFGTIVMGSDCKTLHVAWTAKDNGFFSLFYRCFDTSSPSPGWIGLPITVETGSAAGEFLIGDLEVTLRGRIAITYTDTTDWKGYVRVKPLPCAGVFNPRHQINTGTLGVMPSMQAVGDLVHIVFTSQPANFEVCYRGFCTLTETFTNANQTVIDTQASLITCIASDADCTHCKEALLYVLYGGPGQIKMASVNAVNATTSASWTLQDVDSDTIVAAVPYLHYSLATGENREVFAVYSKLDETNQKLWQRKYKNGVVQGNPTLIQSWGPDRYRIVCGFRSKQTVSNLWATYSGVGMTNYEGVYRTGVARTVEFDQSCMPSPWSQTPPKCLPRLTSANTPTVGAAGGFCLTACCLEANMPGWLVVGQDCFDTPVLLNAPFIADCFLYQNVLSHVPVKSDGCGRWKMCVPLSPALAGSCFYVQNVHKFSATQYLATNSLLLRVAL